MIFIGIESIIFKYGHCDTCSFDIDNDTLTSSEFMNLYVNKCFKYEKEIPLVQMPKLLE